MTVTVFGRHKQTLLTHLSALIPAAADRGSGQADAILVRGDPCGDILILPERSGGFCRLCGLDRHAFENGNIANAI